ncbi:MAG: pyridoxal-5'-phosphate-dependent protein [Flavobacteriaceae bacterium]|nr:pyridoxal-5'-phosphate-dependent protein [Flavobacteriaceae bacterium]|tara:strand:- start:5591 stop:6745 length:1155 start_codon:yes stop_codon:yes gene_type:complete
MNDFLPSCIPNISGREDEYLQDCIKSTFVSSVGEYVNKFEDLTAKLSGYKYGIAVSSGTNGLHLALHCLESKKDDLVLLPDYTFIASANAVSHTGAEPWFFDISKEDLNIDLVDVDNVLTKECFIKKNGVFHKKTHKKISAIMPVFAIGRPMDFEKLNFFKKKWPIPMVIDAAGAMGCKHKNKLLGELNADFSVISFNGNKTFTSGGGGVILTNDKKLYLKARHLSSTARKSTEYIHDKKAFNYRMTNIQAAVGYAQLERFNEFLDKKKYIFNYYEKNIKLKGSYFLKNSDSQSSHWLSFFIYEDNKNVSKEDILQSLKNNNIEARNFWVPMHLQPPYKLAMKSNIDISKDIYNKIVILPSSTNITDKELSRVVNSINILEQKL